MLVISWQPACQCKYLIANTSWSALRLFSSNMSLQEHFPAVASGNHTELCFFPAIAAFSRIACFWLTNFPHYWKVHFWSSISAKASKGAELTQEKKKGLGMKKHMGKWWEAGEAGEVNKKMMHVGRTSPWGVYDGGL